MTDRNRTANICCDSCLPSLLELHQSNLALQEELNQIKYNYNSIRFSQEIKSIIFNNSQPLDAQPPLNFSDGPAKFKNFSSPHNLDRVSTGGSLKSNSFLQQPLSLQTDRNLKTTPRGNINLSSPDVFFSKNYYSNPEKAQINTVNTNTSTNLPTSPEDILERKRELLYSAQNKNEYSLYLKRQNNYKAMLGRPSTARKDNFRFSDSLKNDDYSLAKSIKRQMSLKSEELKGKLRDIYGASAKKELQAHKADDLFNKYKDVLYMNIHQGSNESRQFLHHKNLSYQLENGKHQQSSKSSKKFEKNVNETPEHAIDQETPPEKIKQLSIDKQSLSPLSPLGINDLKITSGRKSANSSYKMMQNDYSGKSKSKEFKFPISSPILNNIIVSARKNYYNNFSSVSNNKNKLDKYDSVSESSFKNESINESTPSKKRNSKTTLNKNLQSKFQEVENYEKGHFLEEEQKSMISQESKGSFLSSNINQNDCYPLNKLDYNKEIISEQKAVCEAPEEMFDSCVRLKDGEPVQDRKLSSSNGNGSSSGVFVYKIVSFHGGRYFSTFDGETEYTLGKKMERAFHRDEEGIISGGFSAHPTISSAVKTRFPSSSRLINNPKILLKLRVDGPTLRLSPNSLAASIITPVEALFIGDQI